MTNLSFAAVLCASVLSADADSYSNAHRESAKGKPMLVLIGTDWCGPCQTMKTSVLPEIRRRGLLSKVAFAIVNPDRDPKLARQLTGGGSSVPQLLLYRKASDGWKRRKLVGRQSVATVEAFIKAGLAAQAATEQKNADTNEKVAGLPGPIRSVSTRQR